KSECRIDSVCLSQVRSASCFCLLTSAFLLLPSYFLLLTSAFLLQFSIHSGNGLLGDIRKHVISSRTRVLRSISVFPRFSSAPHSLAYHSGGISPACDQISFSQIVSMRESQGSNDSQPLIQAYASLRANTPRSG